MSDYEEDDAPRLGVSTIVVGLTVGILSLAIIYNTLTQSTPQAAAMVSPSVEAAETIR